MTSDGVVVQPGETTRDPRLDPILLGDDVRFDEIQVVGMRGTPVPLARMWTKTADDWSMGIQTSAKKTLTAVSFGERAPRRVVTGEGRDFAATDALPADGRVVPPDVVAIEVQLTGANVPNFECAAEIYPVELEGLSDAVEREVRIGRTGRVRVTLPGPGTYVLRADPPFGNRSASPLEPWDGLPFEVLATTKSVARPAR